MGSSLQLELCDVSRLKMCTSLFLFLFFFDALPRTSSITQFFSPQKKMQRRQHFGGGTAAAALVMIVVGMAKGVDGQCADRMCDDLSDVFRFSAKTPQKRLEKEGVWVATATSTSGSQLVLETITLPDREDGSPGHVIYKVADFATQAECAALSSAADALIRSGSQGVDFTPETARQAMPPTTRLPVDEDLYGTLLERVLNLVEDQLPGVATVLFGKMC